MAVIIRNGVNYGDLVVYERDGITFVSTAELGEYLYIEEKDAEVPTFITNLRVNICLGSPDEGDDIPVYALHKNDVRLLAKILSEMGGCVTTVTARYHCLAMWSQGKLTRDVKITDFLKGLTKAEIEESIF